MFLTVHGLSGLALGSKLFNPWLAFVSGVISHFVLDAIPHDAKVLSNWIHKGNERERFILIGLVDVAVFAVMIMWMYVFDLIKIDWSVVMGICGAMVPDFIWTGLDILSLKKYRLARWYFENHEKVHKLFYTKIYVPLWICVPVQVITAALAIYILLKS